MIMLSWLIDVVKDVPPEKWSEIVLSYDARGGSRGSSFGSYEPPFYQDAY